MANQVSDTHGYRDKWREAYAAEVIRLFPTMSFKDVWTLTDIAYDAAKYDWPEPEKFARERLGMWKS